MLSVVLFLEKILIMVEYVYLNKFFIKINFRKNYSKSAVLWQISKNIFLETPFKNIFQKFPYMPFVFLLYAKICVADSTSISPAGIRRELF